MSEKSLLQKLINDELRKGRSYRDLERATKINHVSLSEYHKKGTIPNGKNLAILADYFGVEFHALVEKAGTMKEPPQDPEHFRRLVEHLRKTVLKESMPLEDQYGLTGKLMKLASDETERLKS